VRAAGMNHRYNTPRCPEQNGKVERSHRIDSEEFWSRETFSTFEDAARAVRRWEHDYNWQRFSTALRGETPGEKLQRLIPGVCAA
jgi:transposase InsO family protein